MSIKSIFRAVWPFRPGFLYPWTKAGPKRPLYPEIERLTARSDWGHRQILPGDAIEPHAADPWPADDDPYARPEPCVVVQDNGLSTIRDYAARTNENTRRLAERGLAGRPMNSVKSVTDLLELIERQEAAERDMVDMGFSWDPVKKEWTNL